MSDTSRIQPALSAEEWAAYLLPNGDFVLPEAEKWGDDDPTTGGSISRLGMAALCLHGRISWEMVDALREACDDVDDVRLGLEPLADLLESLLPPRTP